MCLFMALTSDSVVFALSQDEASTATARAELGELIRQLLSDIDPSAKVIVKLTSEKKNLKLPGTALTFKTEDLDQGELFQRADITIISLEGKIPASVNTFIRTLAADYAKNVTINTKVLPAEFQEANKKANTPAARIETPEKSWEQPLADGMKQISQMSTALSLVLKPKLWKDFQLALRNVTRLLTAVLLLITLLGLTAIYLHSTSLRSFERSIRSFAANQNEKAGEKRVPVERTIAPQAKPQTTDVNPMIAQMPEVSVLALLTDCYWTGEDAYAGFLWKRIPYSLRLQLIEHMPTLFEYGSFIAQIPEVDLGYEQDPSYLVPLPIHDVNMQQLTDKVRLHLSLYSRLSILRNKALPITALERLKLHKLNPASLPKEPQDLAFHQSPVRILRKPLLISINSVKDEMEVLAIKDIDFDLIKAAPSLGWLMRLPPETVEKILQAYSARDLASAWIAPPQVLTHLAARIGGKKLALVNAYLEKNSPSRQAPAFEQIHFDIIKEFSSPSSPKAKGEKNAA